MKKVLTLAAVAMFLVGCSTVPARPPDYGPYPSNYKQIAKAGIDRKLKDPGSAIYQWYGAPVKKWCGCFGCGVGWVVPVGVNAKNSFGGYVGMRTHDVCIRYGGVRWISNFR